MDDLLTVAPIAKMLGIKPKTLRNKLAKRNGSAPEAVKVDGGYWIRFEPSAVAAWIASHRTSNR